MEKTIPLKDLQQPEMSINYFCPKSDQHHFSPNNDNR